MKRFDRQKLIKLSLKRLQGLQKEARIERAMVPRRDEGREQKTCWTFGPSSANVARLQKGPWAA